MPNDPRLADDLGSLSKYPSLWMKTFSKVACNGFKFRIKKVDKNSLTQNCGVVVSATSSEGDINYDGVLIEILELDYYGGRNVLLFQCDWVDPIKGVKKGMWKTDEPLFWNRKHCKCFTLQILKRRTGML